MMLGDQVSAIVGRSRPKGALLCFFLVCNTKSSLAIRRPGVVWDSRNRVKILATILLAELDNIWMPAETYNAFTQITIIKFGLEIRRLLQKAEISDC